MGTLYNIAFDILLILSIAFDRQTWYSSLCWEDRPHFLRFPINGDLPHPPAMPPPALGQHTPTHSPPLDGVQFFPTLRAAEPPAPADLFYHAGHQTDTKPQSADFMRNFADAKAWKASAIALICSVLFDNVPFSSICLS